MTFYSDGASQYSHRVRIVLAEKGVTVETVDVDPDQKPEDLSSLNPYNTLPTLVDRDLVLYDANIMMEYLDERFPHPPLFPVYPVARAQSRLWMYRVQRDWCSVVDFIMAGKATAVELDKARKELRESLVSIAPIFAEKPYDCCVTPILWRLPAMGIELAETKTLQPLLEYRARLFTRDSVRASLSEQEREML
jgi:RNA polymerase-associated protein